MVSVWCVGRISTTWWNDGIGQCSAMPIGVFWSNADSTSTWTYLDCVSQIFVDLSGALYPSLLGWSQLRSFYKKHEETESNDNRTSVTTWVKKINFKHIYHGNFVPGASNGLPYNLLHSFCHASDARSPFRRRWTRRFSDHCETRKSLDVATPIRYNVVKTIVNHPFGNGL